jgi:hypothetical protein
MKVFPITTCQQICRWSANALKNTHITPHQPPAIKKAPERAQVVLELISLGVMALKHCLGFAPRGIMKPSFQ